jgi:asparagine synthase (glutamine-hydrolysing)
LNALSPFRHENDALVFDAGLRAEMVGRDPWEVMPGCMANGPDHWLSQLQYMDFHRYLPLDILTKVDRMSMANSLEVRVPLLDHELVEFAATIPPDDLIRGFESKAIFKKALRGLLPEEVLRRRKRGFAIPLGDWFRNDLTGFVRETLLSETAKARGMFDTSYIEQIIKLHESGRSQDERLWMLVSFELWCRQFLDSGISSSKTNGSLAEVSSIAESA